MTHLLCKTVAQFLCLFKPIDVGAGSDPATNAAKRVAYWQRPAKRPAICAAGVPEPILDLIRIAGLEAGAPYLPCPFLIIRMEHAVPAGPVG